MLAMDAKSRGRLSPREALALLREGNLRFREGRPRTAARSFEGAAAGAPQRPFAIVLGCSDSRTPVEILFDQGFGDLFVVRVAGNVVAPSIVGSIEFAASQFGTRLVVVMGHTQLRRGRGHGARRGHGHGPGVGRTSARSPIASARTSRRSCAEAASSSPRSSCARPCASTCAPPSITCATAAACSRTWSWPGELAVVGAEYELETGTVTFQDELAG